MDTGTDLRALAQAGLTALAAGDHARAAAQFDQVVKAGRADAGLWLALAAARAGLGDAAGKLAAIDAALALDPRGLDPLMAKADHMAESGDARGALAFYNAALQHMGRFRQLPAPAQDKLRRAKAARDRMAREFEDFLRARLADAALDEPRAPPRFARAVDILLGRKRPFMQAPRYFYFPELPQIQFYERAAFPWIADLEAATARVRAELEAVLAERRVFDPYLTQDPNRPRASQAGMNDNPDWGAYFLWKDGAEQPGAARCPDTMAALAQAPLTRIPARAPAILFSRLAAGAHIPPHTGMINARVICHLPLIVPNGCVFRVGNEERAWREGQAWVFDDTIEHEAWNRSARDRYVLIFDIWRPELTEEERAAVVALCAAVDSYGAAPASWGD